LNIIKQLFTAAITICFMIEPLAATLARPSEFFSFFATSSTVIKKTNLLLLYCWCN
jgi:hypothetical protein